MLHNHFGSLFQLAPWQIIVCFLLTVWVFVLFPTSHFLVLGTFQF
jgi:hypothetical protein